MKKIYVFFVFLLGSVMIFSQSKNLAIDQPANYEPIFVTPSNDGIASIKWEETFNTTTPPGDWTIVDNDGSGTAWDFRQVVAFTSGDTVYPQAGQSFWFSNFNNANGSGLIDEWLISPQLPMVESGDSLYFWAGSIGGSYPDSFKVWVSTTDINLGSFTQIAYFIVDGPTGSWHQYGFDLSAFAGNQVYVAVNYYIVDGGPSGNSSDNVWLDHFILTGASGGTITIAQAIEDLDNDFIPDRLGQTVTVEGVVFSPNYQTTNNSFYISDGTAGTDIFMYSPPLYTWNMGDLLTITGEVSQYNGMTEIIPADSSGWIFQSSGNPTPDAIVLTLAQYKADPELYEGSLVGFVSLSLVGGTWPAAGSSANLSLSDGADTVVFRIDNDTDIDGQPEPSWPSDVIGIGSQFDSSIPYDGGYQIFPRYYATDFLPPGTLPVELTSFSANVSDRNVILNWTTATEINNSGFEIERKSNGEYRTIAFIQGNGTTTDEHNYSYSDNNLNIGEYTYRLKQVDYDGTFAYSNEVNVSVNAPAQFELAQNYPNPFNPSTKISFSIPQNSEVTLSVFNVLGQKVKTLVQGFMEAGKHTINFDASEFNSGIYFYRLESGNFSEVRKMTLLK